MLEVVSLEVMAESIKLVTGVDSWRKRIRDVVVCGWEAVSTKYSTNKRNCESVCIVLLIIIKGEKQPSMSLC